MRIIMAMGILVFAAGCMSREPSSTTYRIWMGEELGGTELAICVGNDAWCRERGLTRNYRADPEGRTIHVRSTGCRDAEGRWEPMLEALGQAMWEMPELGILEEAGQ
jgi:hypothetical protein